MKGTTDVLTGKYGPRKVKLDIFRAEDVTSKLQLINLEWKCKKYHTSVVFRSYEGTSYWGVSVMQHKPQQRYKYVYRDWNATSKYDWYI